MEWDPPEGPVRAVFVCAHGAGGHMNDRSILAVSNAMRSRGIGTVRFNFDYRDRGSGRPDPMPKLLERWRAVVAEVRDTLKPKVLILGGRSMGGRAASVLVSEGEPCDGLLLLAYPLHPPGQQHKLRVEHLPRITVPVLCINGTRDPFCDPPLMQKTLESLGPAQAGHHGQGPAQAGHYGHWRMLWLEGADHSFHVLKSSGRTDAQVLDQVADETVAWLGLP